MNEPVAMLTRSGEIGYLQFNRPSKINAMDGEMYEMVGKLVEEFDGDPSLRCLIIYGAGGNFSSGGDLAWTRQERLKAKAEGRKRQYLYRAFQALDRCEKPVIAAIDGYALASGFNMSLLYCDIRIATPQAKFGHPSAKRGLTGSGNLEMYATPYTWHMGLGDALYLFLTGSMVNASQAHQMGLVNEVVPVEELLPRAEEVARLICEGAPDVIIAQKKLLRRFQEVPGSFYPRLREIIFDNLGDRSFLEGTSAFLEKRSPDWTKVSSHQINNQVASEDVL